MRFPSSTLVAVLATAVLSTFGDVAPVAAQDAPALGPALSLQDAIELARRNNPGYLSTVRDVDPAGYRVRQAYAAFVPSVSTSIDASFREGRPQFFGGQAFGASADVISSSYGVSAVLNLSPSTLLAPRQAKANLSAAEADVVAARQTLAQTITTRYLAVLQQQARVLLQDTLLATARTQLALAEARAAAGAGTILEVQRAEVTVGQAEVERLRAANQAEIEKLRLFQQMGVQQPGQVQLVTDFPVQEPTFALDELLRLAEGQNPTLAARRARERAQQTAFSSARGSYAPTLSLSAGVGGFTNQITDNGFVLGSELARKQGDCRFANEIRGIVGQPSDPAACSAIALTPAERAAALDANSAFPFQFQRQPYNLSAQLSLPLFNGLNRELQIQEAAAQRDNARYDLRAFELQLTADVTGAYRTLLTDYAAIQLQQRAAATARQALELAQERYRVGASNFVEVAQAQSDFATAQNGLINAIYTYHTDYAALEAAVGRPLR